MAEPELQHVRRLSADNQIVSKSDVPLKERFFRYFQHEITGIMTPQDSPKSHSSQMKAK